MNTTLIIMAAGIGSRYGKGIKQLAKIGPHDEIIMDYSIYDALEAGFNKVVFIIRKDIEKEFKEVIGNRIEKHIQVEYVFQEINNIPEGCTVPEGRIKPWGTGQAILSCKGIVNEPFVIINADDYYGKVAFKKLHDFLIEDSHRNSEFTMAMAGFILKNTLSDNGTVTRGICVEDEEGYLHRVIETKGITSRKYMDKEISNHKFDLIKDVNFTNSYFAYVPTTELAPLPLYRRLKLDPYEMATTIISLIIEASDFPLKLTLEFEKDSVRYKRYVHLFDALNDIQDQLECYMALEGITMTRLAKEIGFPKYAYNNIFARIIKFNDFKQLTDMVGAKIKITFTPQIIKTYSSCKLMFEKMLSNIDDMVFKNDQCKESIKYQLFCSIIREAPELAIVESLIELEQLRRSSNLALFNQKDVDIFEESKKKEADSK